MRVMDFLIEYAEAAEDEEERRKKMEHTEPKNKPKRKPKRKRR